jgi:hypothetical protein
MPVRAIGPLLCGGLLLLATSAFAAQGDPLPGIDVSMEQNPGGIVIKQVKSNKQGIANFGTVQPGTYTIRQGGQLVKIITITKAGPLSVPITQGGAALAPPKPGVGLAPMPAIPVPGPAGGSNMMTLPQ